MDEGVRADVVDFRARRTRTTPALKEGNGRMLVATGVLLSTWLLIVPACLWAQSGMILEVGKFSDSQVGTAMPDGWKPLTFKKIPRHTFYEVVKDGGVTIVKAVSEASASGLIKPVVIDPKEFPIVRWRWKIDNVLQRSDVALKEGDDFPARLYITFAYDPDRVSFGKKLKFKAGQALFGDIPIAALNYIWETKTPVGTIVDNAYTDFAKMVVVESGDQKVGMWIDEERNIYEDYKRAFGEEPPMINGVAIMSDTDNTKEQATAYYGDIIFQKSAKGSAQ
ncbi:MAG TPA: DUF3047 domain-containing protein [Nitrospiraceae bacterium]|nr:DUF3047 domain-containing protein [Nitrospiraceae bacterium]